MFKLTFLMICGIGGFLGFKYVRNKNHDQRQGVPLISKKFIIVSLVIILLSVFVDYKYRDIKPNNVCKDDMVVTNPSSYFSDNKAYDLCNTKTGQTMFRDPNKAFNQYMKDYGKETLTFSLYSFDLGLLTRQGMIDYQPCCDWYDDHPFILDFISDYQNAYRTLPIQVTSEKGFDYFVYSNAYLDTYTDDAGQNITAPDGRVYLESVISIRNINTKNETLGLGVKDIRIESEKGNSAKFIPHNDYLSLDTEDVDFEDEKVYKVLKKDDGIQIKVLLEVDSNVQYYFVVRDDLGTEQKYDIES